MLPLGLQGDFGAGGDSADNYELFYHKMVIPVSAFICLYPGLTVAFVTDAIDTADKGGGFFRDAFQGMGFPGGYIEQIAGLYNGLFLSGYDFQPAGENINTLYILVIVRGNDTTRLYGKVTHGKVMLVTCIAHAVMGQPSDGYALHGQGFSLIDQLGYGKLLNVA